MCQSLLADTNLKVKLGDVLSEPFQTTIGTPQGDGLSPILFAIYLEKALRDVRRESEPHRPAIDKGIPPEAIYADDTDFISRSQDFLKFLETLIPPTLQPHQLVANDGKWERTTLSGEVKGNDSEWKKTKKLGSLLGDEEDVERRIVLATASFKKLRLLWERKKLTSIETRMRAYNALVIPVLLYNSGTWGITNKIMDRLEKFHRRQLREIIGVKTRGVHNENLYKICNTYELKGRIIEARWALFGHTLRLDRNTPAQQAMDYYCENGVGAKGRPVTTLPVLLFNEYEKYVTEKRGIKKYSKSNNILLKELRELAGDKGKWRELVNDMCELELRDKIKC